MDTHQTHKDRILGRYCWQCRAKVVPGVPGWPMAHRGPSTGYSVWDYNKITGKGYTEAIVWANGDIERARDQSQCSLCDKNCKYPVSRAVTNEGDSYKEIRKKMVK